ncbi:hypothetical protein OQA88_1650 [Cercophora sp. LCS_1]
MLTSYALAAALALVAGTHAQTSTPSSQPSGTTGTSSSASSTSTGKIIDIAVGAELHKFTPDSVKANPGDIIRFGFYPGGHRVARAEFMQPCIPYERTGANKRGFYSGVFSPQVLTNPPPYYDVLINDTEPVFFYCGAPGSCIQYGMVGVINPNSTHTLAIQKQYAANSTLQLTPDEPWPSETLSPTAGPKETGGSSSGQNGNNNNNQDTQASSGGSDGLGAGAIAGIAIGAAAVILGAVFLFLWGRKRGEKSANRQSTNPAMPPGTHPGMAEAGRYHDPKSPGQASMSTFMGMERDPYRVSQQSPHMPHYSSTPPPPVSPGMPGYGNYQSPVIPGQYSDAPHHHQQQHGYQ